MDNYLATLIVRERNMNQLLKVLQDLTTTNVDVVDIQFENSDGSTQTFAVQSIASLMSRVSNMESNLEQITNLDNLSSATILLPNGNIRAVIAVEQEKDPEPFLVNEITEVGSKNNPLKHLMIDPFIYAKVEVSREKYASYDKAKLLKMIFTLDTEDKIAHFDTELKGSNVEYSELVTVASKKGIKIEEVFFDLNLAPATFEASGKFDVIGIEKKKKVIPNTEDIDESYVFRLNTLFYKNTTTGADIYLKVGSKILVGSNTTYVVDFVDKSTRYVGLKVVKGYEPIVTGVDVLQIYENAKSPYAEVPISSSENVAVFMKPINSDMLIESSDWGVGYVFSTNDILGGKSPASFWKAIEAVTGENITPSTDFIKPTQPKLLAENFKTVTVNKHKEAVASEKDISKKFSEKVSVESKQKIVLDDIQTTKELLATTPADNVSEKNRLSKKLSKLEETVKAVTVELNSKIIDLSALATSLKEFKPKYEIHGFISESIPAVKDGVEQKVIGYDTEYRYLSVDETVDENQSFDVIDGNVNKKAIIPKWLKMPTPKIREKDTNGNWVDENTASVDDASIAQITIPITEGEVVEIRTRAISEVGYPFQLNYSDWSESLKVKLDSKAETNTAVVVQQAGTDEAYLKIYDRLVELGIIGHNLDSLKITDKYYPHSLKNIATAELTPENRPVDAQTIVDAIMARVATIEKTIGHLSGTVTVKILAEDQSLLATVSNNTTIKYTDEFYKNIVEDLTVKKGFVVNRTMYVEITNVSDGDIEILPFVTGVSTDQLTPAYVGYTNNNDEYNNFRKYYDAPLVRRNTNKDSEWLDQKRSSRPHIEVLEFQSSQVKSQGIYSRKKDITLGEDIYGGDVNNLLLPEFSLSSTQAFIWDGTQTTVSPVGGGGHTEFCVHIDHPMLDVTSEYMQDWSLYYSTGVEKTLPKQSYDNNKAYYPIFVSDTFSCDDTSVKQLAYRRYTPLASLATKSSFPNKSMFLENDRYLIGRKTCGMFLSLGDSQDLYMNERFVASGRKIAKGERYLVPIVASSRLTDYYGVGNTGVGNIGGVLGWKNVAYTKKIGIDVLVKESKLELPKLISFDFQYTMQYQKNSVN